MAPALLQRLQADNAALRVKLAVALGDKATAAGELQRLRAQVVELAARLSEIEKTMIWWTGD
jgi:hypothetical protein